jgi:hypothetical protein
MNMRFAHFLVFILLLVGSASCTKDLPLPDVNAQKRIVLLGELIAGDTIALRGSVSMPVAKGSTLNPEVPTDLTLRVSGEAMPAVDILGLEDGPTSWLKTVSLSAPQVIQHGTKYRLFAQRPGLADAQAEVSIPFPFGVEVVDTQSVRFAGLPCLKMQIRIHDRPGEKNQFIVEVARQFMNVNFEYEGEILDVASNFLKFDSLVKAGVPVDKTLRDTSFAPAFMDLRQYTTDDVTENVRIGSPTAAARRVMLSDMTFEGRTHDLQIYVDKTWFTNDSIQNVGLGRVVVSVKSVSEDYFKYLKGYETVAPLNTVGFLSQPVRIEGNIKGGLGVVGGVYRVPFYYYFDKVVRP